MWVRLALTGVLALAILAFIALLAILTPVNLLVWLVVLIEHISLSPTVSGTSFIEVLS
jgi:hypothetical protein